MLEQLGAMQKHGEKKQIEVVPRLAKLIKRLQEKSGLMVLKSAG